MGIVFSLDTRFYLNSVEYLQIEYYITVTIDISSKGESYGWFGWFGKDAS